jgi:hypothetical protein
MEINNTEGEILGVMTSTTVVEGLMVFLGPKAASADFGSNTDLATVRAPLSADEAKKSRYIVTWPQTLQKPPFYNSLPSYSFAQRGGFDQAVNVPFNADVWMTYPGMQNGKTIPSGTGALAFGEGTYTVPSGSFIDSAGIKVAGTPLSVNYTGATAGKLQAEASFSSDVCVATVVEFDTSTYALTFKIG